MSVTSQPPSLDHPKLPFWRTVRLSYSAYFNHFADVLRISWLWLVVIAPLAAYVSWLQTQWLSAVIEAQSQGSPVMPPAFVAIDLFTYLLNLLAGVSIAVAWHRLLILNEGPGLSGANVANASVWRYAGMAILIALISMLPALAVILPVYVYLGSFVWSGSPMPAPPSGAVLPAIILPLFFLIYVIAVVLALRLSLALPARAVGDNGLTFRESWKRTKGNTWRLFWGVALCAVVPVLIAQIVAIAVLPIPAPDQNPLDALKTFASRAVLMAPLFVVYYFLTLPISVGFLSFAYMHFFRRT